MFELENKLKGSKFTPVKILGTIIFGTQGELWDSKKIGKGVGT